MEGLILAVVLGALGFAGIAVAAGRPHTVVELDEGAATVVRGRLPPGLLADLHGVAKLAPEARGRVELRGGGPTLRVQTRGLAEPVEQRVRNVVLLARSRIRPA